jgi:endonuclease/exonuclease/phosphatase family metal-dependent hydrolase
MSEKNTHIVDATNMISVMSYNIQVGNSDNNPVGVSTMIRNYMPDLLGVQEADGEWMSVLNNRLSKNGYAYVGIGRDSDGKGERSAIFYRADKFELISSQTLWLSATPDVVSRVEGALCNRIVTMATFKRLSDGKIFTHANTHLDHSNATVRSQQVTFLDQYVKEFAEEEFIVTGDFNFQPDNRVYAQMMDLGYENCSRLATYARGRDDNTFTGGSMIDFCFRYGNNDFAPYFYTVCDELISGKTPADHHRIFLMLELK